MAAPLTGWEHTRRLNNVVTWEARTVNGVNEYTSIDVDSQASPPDPVVPGYDDNESAERVLAVGSRTAGVRWRRDNSGVSQSVAPLGLTLSGTRRSSGLRPGAPGLHPYASSRLGEGSARRLGLVVPCLAVDPAGTSLARAAVGATQAESPLKRAGGRDGGHVNRP